MQERFVNANIITQTDDLKSSMLVSSGKITFIGDASETKVVSDKDCKEKDLQNRYILPSFYYATNMFKTICKDIKNANLVNFSEKSDEIYQNDEIFCIFKEHFIELQNKFLSSGIATVLEFDCSSVEFEFFKKLSNLNLIKLKINVYINMLSDMELMHNNCRTYRKYVKGLRIGGYYIKLDGKLHHKLAWISKNYHKDFHAGSTDVGFEQLHFLIKNAIDERERIVVEANGDRAVEQFITCLEEIISDEKSEDIKFLSPVIQSIYPLKNGTLKQIKKYNIKLCYPINDIINLKSSIDNVIGKRIAGRILNIDILDKFNIDYFFFDDDFSSSFFDIIKFILNRKFKGKLSKASKINGQIQTLIMKINNNMASCINEVYDYFDNLVGEDANFIVLNKDPFNWDSFNNIDVENIFICGEEHKWEEKLGGQRKKSSKQK